MSDLSRHSSLGIILLTEIPRPQPERGNKGSNILGPQNPDRQKQNPDGVRPPVTDSGKMPNMKW